MWYRKAMRCVAIVALAALTGSCSSGSGAPESAAQYPSEEIRIIVPYTAGGPTDLAARAMGGYYERALGQPVIVENLPGAAGSVGMNELISSEPDGYTIKLIAAPSTVVTPLIQDVEYGPRDFETIGIISEVPSVLAVGAESRYDTAEDFFAAAKQRPGGITVGTPGATTSQAIELRRLATEYDTEVTVVPFDGNAELTQALLGGNVDAILVNASQDIRSQIDAGDFRPLAISPAERVPYLPDVPTLSELGYDKLTYSTSLFGFGVPVGTPPQIVRKLEDTMEAGLQDPEVTRQLDEAYVPDRFVGAQEFRERLDEIVEVYRPVAQELRGG